MSDKTLARHVSWSLAAALLATCLVAAATTTVPARIRAAEKTAPLDDGSRLRADMPAPERLVAIGDVHGDFETFVRLLKEADLVDAELAWSGGEAVLVQTGDLLDRGADSRKALDLVRRLQEEARDAGGRVVFTPGNHELFNIVGDFRYLHEDELIPYAREEKPLDRARALRELEEFADRPKPLLRSSFYESLSKRLRQVGQGQKFPPGYFRHRELFAPDGEYGKWILQQDIVVKIGDTLFLHAGLGERFGKEPFRDLRKRFRQNVREYFELRERAIELGVFHPLLGDLELRELLDRESRHSRVAPQIQELISRQAEIDSGVAFSMDGPLWERGLAELSRSLHAARVSEILRAQDAERIAIGHTRTLTARITSRFGGRVILLDTGMNQDVYGGKPEALEMRQGKVKGVIRARSR